MAKKWLAMTATLVGLSLFVCPNLYAAYQLNMTPGVTPISKDIYHLHMTILWICCAIGIGVFATMIYAIIYHRKSRGYKAATFHESVTVEIIWTFLPFVVLIAMAIPATKVLINLEDSSEPDMTIKVTGYRWYWHYDYINEDINYYSFLSTPEDEIQNLSPKNPNYLLEVDEPVVVPIDKKVRFLFTSNDVIHAWWVPALAVKKDAIPGLINDAWAVIEKPGIYRGQCAELCGTKHGYMPIVVEARTQEEYDKWIVEKKSSNQAMLHH